MQCNPSGPAPAKIMVVGEAPGDEELRKGVPFVGGSGLELTKMLREAGIDRNQCFLTNVVRIKPPGGRVEAFVALKKNEITPQHGLIRDLPCLPPVWEGLALLKREIELVRPNIIIALGNLPLWALTGEWGVMKWRGSQLQCKNLGLTLDYEPKVIPTYHPVTIMRQWSWRPILVNDLRRCERESKSRELIRPDYKFIIRPDFNTAAGYLAGLMKRADEGKFRVTNDIETRNGHIACIGIGWSKTEAICIPLMDSTKENNSYWTADEEAALMFVMHKFLTHPNVEVVGQNFIYDAQYFYRHLHYVPRFGGDTMLQQHSCFSNMRKGLDFLSSMYCEFHRYWKDDGKTWDEKTGEDQLWYYNCEDCVRTFEIDQVEANTLKVMKLESVATFQNRLFYPVLRTMNRGLRVDHNKRAQFAMKLIEEISSREAWMYQVLGESVNIKSPKQMQELFYGSFGQKPIFDRKTGGITANAEALGKIADREPLLRPLVKKILELRSLGVFLSTFVNAPLDIDGRIRCSFDISGTETYRFSSSKNAFDSGLNLQNIPKGGDDGDGLELPNIRELFVPDPGYTFFDIDLNSADLRIVVWESDEAEFKAMLRSGADAYTEIAKEFYHDPSITKKDPRRQLFKAFAHGTNYLGTAKGLAERLGLSVHQAEQTQKWYFGKFPGIKKWQEDIKNQVLSRRYVQNVFGYRCYFFDRIEGTIFNQAIAWIPQSTVGCLINRAYVNLHENHEWCEILLQVHDSLAGQYPTSMGEAAEQMIVRAAEIELPYNDPLTIPVGVKTSRESWGMCG